MRALVVEDDPSIRDLLEKFLSPVARCDVAEDGLSGMEALARALDGGDPYQLVCLDLVMPLMDGWETLARIRDMEQGRGVAEADRVKVIILTARDSSQNIRRMLDGAPCEAFLLKPFRKSDLLDQIRALGLLGAEPGF